MSSRKSSHVLQTDKPKLLPKLARVIQRLYNALNGLWPEDNRSHFQEVKAGRKWPSDNWLEKFGSYCSEWWRRSWSDAQKSRPEWKWANAFMVRHSGNPGASAIIELAKAEADSEDRDLTIVNAAIEPSFAGFVSLPAKENLFHRESIELQKEAQHLATSPEELRAPITAALRSKSRRMFRRVIVAEIIDLTKHLDGGRISFFATDTFLNSNNPSVWRQNDTLSLLIEATDRLAAERAFRFDRSWRVFVLPSPEQMLLDANRRRHLLNLVNFNIARSLTVGLATSAAMHPDHAPSMWNMYLIPKKVVLFGAQPIPVTCRYKNDSEGRHMVLLGERLAEHLREEASKGTNAVKITNKQDDRSLSLLLSQIATVKTTATSR